MASAISGKSGNLKSKQAQTKSSQKEEKPDKSKIIQDEFRKLLREKQASQIQNKHIQSPLAKYNNLGQLVCVLCNLKIKNEFLWTAHVSGRNHKDSLARLKKKKEAAPATSNNGSVTTNPKELPARTVPNKRKGSLEGQQSVPEKKLRTSTDSSKNLRVSFSLSDDEEDADQEATKLKDSTTGLPADFFDAEMTSLKETASKEETTSKESSSTKLPPKDDKQPSSALPDGFFDDPVMDAKIRKVEYKDPMDDEWDKFQKAISEASSVSQAMVEENDEEMKAEREIDEIEQQIHNWARVEALQQRKDECLRSQEEMVTDVQEESSPEKDDEEMDEFLDWRSKGVWR